MCTATGERDSGQQHTYPSTCLYKTTQTAVVREDFGVANALLPSIPEVRFPCHLTPVWCVCVP